ncbi:MAG: sulfurtransferase complex subunit TusD [Halieaceae bacterium]|jgi:tRNA 2-thiouridine synthesizing protein D|nr:sulfurtransferase complex subunit TusD [Halieaceae bacterium]
MRFSLLVSSPPADSYGSDPALQFARAVVRSEHELHRVFFYGDGVFHGSALAVVPRDRPDTAEQWAALAAEHQVDLVLCSASATRRGVLDRDEAERRAHPAASAHAAFALSGLGQLADTYLLGDRIVTFGGTR